jgi:hypothetical protein
MVAVVAMKEWEDSLNAFVIAHSVINSSILFVNLCANNWGDGRGEDEGMYNVRSG